MSWLPPITILLVVGLITISFQPRSVASEPQQSGGEAITIAVLGDSLSAAYGIDPDRGWVALLEQRLAAAGPQARVINAGISGDTTSGGLQRLPQLLERERPDWLLLELGANDGLRAYPAAAIERNLRQLVALARAAGSRVVLIGIRLPPNYGPVYSEAFEAIYPRIASDLGLPLVPFLLEGVALNRAWMQDDGLHPNELGQPQIAQNVWSLLGRLLTPAASPTD
jgi:acyl-CoA thioesterase-1